MKILLYDLETAPNVSYTWGKYEQNVIAFEKESYMLCYAYQWLDEGKTRVVVGETLGEDKDLAHSLWALFNEADIIIAHNGDAFDNKYSCARFLAHGLEPPTTYRSVDTLKIARQRFRLNSNKLNDLGELLNLGKKVETGGFDLWLGCMQGDAKSWRLMKKYNKQDVDLLRLVYEALRPWMKNHPNLSVDERACGVCRSLNLVKAGFHFMNTAKHQRWKCTECGANHYTSLKRETLPKVA